MSYSEMTLEEFIAISSRDDFDWYDFYNAGRPPIWRPIQRWRFDREPESLALRKACIEFGGFDPARTFEVREL